MRRRLPLLIGLVGAAAGFFLLGPFIAAGWVLRFSSDAQGLGFGAQALMLAIILLVAGLSGWAAWSLARLFLSRRG